MPRPRTTTDRFWSKVDVRGWDECWPWLAGPDFKIRGEGRAPANAAWELTYGRIPRGYLIQPCQHLETCCNPVHVRPRTWRDRMRDRTRAMQGAGRTLFGGTEARRVHGEDNPAAKLTEAQVRAIRTDRRPLKVIAREYHHVVSPGHICRIRTRRRWRNI